MTASRSRSYLIWNDHGQLSFFDFVEHFLLGAALGQAASTMDQSDIRGLAQADLDQSHHEHVPS
jgi:hypothetical protein